ncbi:uncharacterized protein ACNS7B_016224 [Menidia menidia]
MKLILTLTLIGTLSSAAGALDCEVCSDPTCSSTTTVTCGSETMCISASINVTSSEAKSQVYKNCSSSTQCPATGCQDLSVNFGSRSAAASVLCCNTNSCNAATRSCEFSLWELLIRLSLLLRH